MGQPEATPPKTFPELKGFRVFQELSRTPSGVVYKVRRLVEHDVVVAKLLRPSTYEKRFLKELSANAEATFILEHKGLVRSLGCVMEDERPVLLMEYAPGEPLSKALWRGAQFPLSRALLIALQCANALHYAFLHNRYHGRLHPADIILGDDHARIIGVGLGERPQHAAWSDHEPHLHAPLIYTAPEAMPSKPFPEAAAGRAAVDIYSLGAILFHILITSPPFVGTDEGALDAERKALPGPVAWPPKKSTLPPDLVALVEKMLAPDPAKRPSYEALVYLLARALTAAEKAEAAKPATPAAAAPVAKPSSPPPVASWEARQHHRPAVSTAPSDAPTQPVAPVQVLMPPSHASRLYANILQTVTALVMIAALVLLAYHVLWRPIQQPEVAQHPPAPPADRKPAPSAPPAKAEPAPAPVAPAPPVDSGPKTQEYAAAAGRLNTIQELLAKKEVRHSAALAKMLRDIAAKAGAETTVGLKATLLAAEIDEALERDALARAAQAPPRERPAVTAAPEPAKKEPAPAAEPATVMPPKPAATAATEPPKTATTPPAEPPKTAPAETPPAKTASETPLTPKLAGVLKGLAAKAKTFKYGDANAELLRVSAGLDGDDKTALDTYRGLLRQEVETFKRCRERLVAEIQKNPRHESPLQVFPRRNEPGDDIVDFDEGGLRISEKRAGGAGVRLHPWEKTPPAQAFALLQLLADRNNLEDQLGLAVFAFHRGLKDELAATLNTARALQSGRERADRVEATCKQFAKQIE
jgi:serine/threonine-protein kinase